MEKIKIAKIVNAVGLKGEVKVYNYSDVRERFEELDEIIISGKKQ
ncbi:MAG: 16S rRNA processing protein RimM, partial [Firmicutes bacterium]|nr:16S rRNA processing protein RimM [Bacillota bacterium]